MSLDNIPVRLNEDTRQKWRALVLDFYRRGQGGEDGDEAQLQEDLERELDSSSVRAPLSRLLNGHGDEIRKWFCGEGDRPNAKGRALVELCEVQVDDLIAGLRAILPRHEASRLTARDLKGLPLTVREISFPPRVKHLHEEIREFESTFNPGEPLHDVLDRLEALLADLPDIEQSINLSPPHPQRGGLEQALLESRYGASPQIELHERSLLSPDLTTVRVSPTCQESLRAWFDTLREHGRIDDEQRARLEAAFAEHGAGEVRWPDRESLLDTLNAIVEGRLDVVSPRAAYRTQVESLKRRLTARRAGVFQSWALTSGEFFRRWIRRHGRLDVKLTDEDLRDLLQLEEPPELNHDIVYALLTSGSFDEHAEVRRGLAQDLLAHLPTPSLLTTLKQADVFHECEDAPGWLELSEDWRRLAWMELLFTLRPEDGEVLTFLEVEVFLEEIVRIAPEERLLGWVDMVLDDPTKPDEASAVLFALMDRPDRASCLDDERLIRLWAVNIWYTLATGSPHWHARLLHEVSEALHARLPQLRGHDPLGHIEALVPLALREHFPLGPPWDELLSMTAGARAESASLDAQALKELVQRAPFQLPLDLILEAFELTTATDWENKWATFKEPNLENRLASSLMIWWARRGDARAQRFIWHNAWSASSSVEEFELLRWISSLTREDLQRLADRNKRKLRALLLWARELTRQDGEEQELREALIHALKHLYSHADCFDYDPHRTLAPLTSMEGRLISGEEEKFPTLGVLRALHDLENEDLSDDDINTRLVLFLAWPEEGLELASDLDHVRVLKRLASLHDADADRYSRQLEQSLVEHNLGLLIDFERMKVEAYPLAETLLHLHDEALKRLWLLGEKQPLRAHMRRGEPAHVNSRRLRRSEAALRVLQELQWRARSSDCAIPDDIWESIGEALSLDWSSSQERYTSYPLPLQVTVRSPLRDIDPEHRAALLVAERDRLYNYLLSNYLLSRAPREIREFFFDTLEIDRALLEDPALELYHSGHNAHQALLDWARDHDDELLREWCQAQLERGDLEGLLSWVNREGEGTRAERVWSHLDGGGRLALLKRLEHVREGSPLLAHLDLFECPTQRLCFVREHEAAAHLKPRLLEELLRHPAPLFRYEHEVNLTLDENPWFFRLTRWTWELKEGEREQVHYPERAEDLTRLAEHVRGDFANVMKAPVSLLKKLTWGIPSRNVDIWASSAWRLHNPDLTLTLLHVHSMNALFMLAGDAKRQGSGDINLTLEYTCTCYFKDVELELEPTQRVELAAALRACIHEHPELEVLRGSDAAQVEKIIEAFIESIQGPPWREPNPPAPPREEGDISGLWMELTRPQGVVTCERERDLLDTLEGELTPRLDDLPRPELWDSLGELDLLMSALKYASSRDAVMSLRQEILARFT